MGNQFKKPFPLPEESPEGSFTLELPEQDTARTPALSVPPQGSVQGQCHGTPVHLLVGIRQALPVIPPGGSSMATGPQGVNGPGLAYKERLWVPAGLRETPASVQERKRSQASRKKRRIPIWARVVMSVPVFFTLLGVSAFACYQFYFAGAVNSMTNQQVVRITGETDPNQGRPSDVLNWGRINILLLGSDTDEKGVWAGNVFLAQTLIVASIDTTTHEVDLLSIPRDFYLRIPGHGMDKLDTAFAYGGSVNHQISGVATVYATLDQDFGIKINFYGWVGLQGFIKVINTVGGVDVNVLHPVVDDTYPDDITSSGNGKQGFGYRRIYIADGPQHLDGATALEYVRSRHSTNDFDRSARQQQVLSALRLKLDNPDMIPWLPQIADDLKGSLATSLAPLQLLELGNFARGIDARKIRHLTLSAPTYGRAARVPVHGQLEDVVLPDCHTIPAAVNTFFHSTSSTCTITSTAGRSSPVLAHSSGRGAGTESDTSISPVVSTIASFGQGLEMGQALAWWNDLFGMHDLLALMSLVVLDSPQI